MKQSILTPSPWEFCRKQRLRKLICLLTALTMVGLNVLFTCLRTEENHVAMLCANILTDSVGGCFSIYCVTACVLPAEKLYRLTRRPVQRVHGGIGSIATETVRYMDVDCLELTVGGRTLFLPAGTIALKVGDTADFSVVSGVIVEVDYA